MLRDCAQFFQEMTVVDSVDMLRRVMMPRYTPRVVGGDISLFDDIHDYASEQRAHRDGTGPYPLPEPSSVFLGTIVAGYYNVSAGNPSLTVQGTIDQLGVTVNSLRSVLNDFAHLPPPPLVVAAGPAVPLPAARADAGGGGAGGYVNPLLSRNFAVTDAEVAAAHVSGYKRATMCISMMPHYTSLNAVGATLGVPVAFLDLDRIRNLCDWSVRAKQFYRAKESIFPWHDDYTERIETYRNTTKIAMEDILRLMVRVCHRAPATTSPQLLQKLNHGSGSAVPFRSMSLQKLPSGPYMVCPFDTCLNLDAARPPPPPPPVGHAAPLPVAMRRAGFTQDAHPDELQWIAHRSTKEAEFLASLRTRR